jgi:hypothetical protein
MRYIWKVLGWVVYALIPFLVVLLFVFLGHLIGINEVVSAAASVGIMLAITTNDMNDGFKKTNESLTSISDRIALIESRLDDVQDSLRQEFDD